MFENLFFFAIIAVFIIWPIVDALVKKEKQHIAEEKEELRQQEELHQQEKLRQQEEKLRKQEEKLRKQEEKEPLFQQYKEDPRCKELLLICLSEKKFESFLKKEYKECNFSFKVKARRARKNYPLDSMEINKELGAATSNFLPYSNNAPSPF